MQMELASLIATILLWLVVKEVQKIVILNALEMISFLMLETVSALALCHMFKFFKEKKDIVKLPVLSSFIKTILAKQAVILRLPHQLLEESIFAISNAQEMENF